MKNYIKLCCKILKIPIIFIICMGFMLIVSCNKKEEEHKHSLVNVSSVQATCLQDGQMEYWVCKECNKCFGDSAGTTEISRESTIVSATGHDYDYDKPKWKWNGYSGAEVQFTCKNDSTHNLSFNATITSTSISATCEMDGKKTYTASAQVNSKTYSEQKEEVLPKTGHTIVEDASKEATCEEDGLTLGTHCSVCDEVLLEQEVVPKKGHQYDLANAIWIWDGFESAKLKATCTHDASHVQEYMATITSTTIDPSCTSVGKTIYTATVSLNDVAYTNQKEEIIPATGHDYDYEHFVWEWDGYDKAVLQFTCLNDSTHKVSLDATVTSTSLPATCEANGKTTYTASVQMNGKTYKDQREEVLPATEHNYDYDEPKWEWDGYDKAVLQFTCKNDSTHHETHNVSIEQSTTPSTCTLNGNITYTASIELQNKSYKDQKVETLPIDETNHALDFDYIDWEWAPVIEGYEVKATVYCGCSQVVQTEDAFVDSEIASATFEQDGNIIYRATAFDSYEDRLYYALPMKKRVATEEEFLTAIQEDRYDLTLTNDIVLSEGARLEGTYAAIDLNGYTITMPNYKMRIVATHASIRNGYLVTDLDNLVGSYVIASDERANIVIEDVTTFGGINIWNATAVLRNVDVTATFYYAVCAQGEGKVTVESAILRKSFISNCANTFFWVEAAGVEDDIPYDASKLILRNDVKLYTATKATLYNTGGVSPVYEKEPTIVPIDPKEYLASDLEFKCLSLNKDLIYTEDDLDLVLTGRKVIVDLEGHKLKAYTPIRIESSLARIRNGFLEIEDQDFVLTIENESVMLLDNLNITGGIEVKNATLTIKNVLLSSRNSYAVAAYDGADILITQDSSLSYTYQPKLKTTKVCKNLSGINNYFYYVEEGSTLDLEEIEHETLTDAEFFDPSGISFSIETKIR
ncbi:MAG: hypothetical protein NC310_05790 [Roseburia sp.]|nr:hypothetical protein [Anaeroplasma bactoclasticum]MCM1196561.1 hypothetical protein [Roseburia sp.]MCM1557594.1 hypothetical protein [Anaeroplasma bactoclasticum]